MLHTHSLSCLVALGLATNDNNVSDMNVSISISHPLLLPSTSSSTSHTTSPSATSSLSYSLWGNWNCCKTYFKCSAHWNQQHSCPSTLFLSFLSSSLSLLFCSSSPTSCSSVAVCLFRKLIEQVLLLKSSIFSQSKEGKKSWFIELLCWQLTCHMSGKLCHTTGNRYGNNWSTHAFVYSIVLPSITT